MRYIRTFFLFLLVTFLFQLLSDEAKNIDTTYLLPLTYKDAHILGTLAPAVPLSESLMQDPYFELKFFA